MSGSLAITLLAALGAALVLGTIAHRLRMAPMIGYIAAGLVVGPFTPGFVANTDEVQALADIGVALLMFSIGIQFRIAELWQVGRLVLIGAPLQVAITMGLGVGTSVLLGIPFIEALFIGASVSVCSSVVLAKVAGERDLEATLHGRIALSWSIVQDLLTVVLVVLLSAVAAPAEDPFVGALLSSTIALGFVAGVLVVGSRALPALLGRIAHLGSRELFIVAVAVVAIGTAALAHEVGVSVALGAFVAGLALAESDLAASVLGEIVPLRELFATVFFVFIGLLLQPGVVLAGWPIVLTLLLLITLGKALPITGIVAVGGHRLPMALRVGGLLGQSGEFSFVLATVGLELGVLGSETFSQAMGAVVLSILAAGPLAAGAARLGDWVGSRAAPSEPMPEVSPAAEMRRHTIVAGYGTVGRTVARVLQARGIPWVAVDADYPMVRAALQSGVPIIYGNAGTPSVLDVARIDQASTVVFAMDDALAIRQGMQHALRRNERLHVVARAHSAQEESDLRRMGAARVITAERELGNELVRHTLWRYGVSEREIDAILRRRS
ncbi:MAG TPA: cation:proton antiporter [Candidatus Limnocylindria bacterium]|nr:cation:proton antiporter [Candidatus Limnocylindria bacterium]